MKQVIRKGLKEIIVDEVPDPVLLPHHVLVRPLYSLISSGTETASIHRDSLVSEVAENPSHLRKIWDVAMKTGPVATVAEVRAKFSEYAVLGYSGAGVVAARHATVTDLEIGQRVAYGGEGTGHGETILVGRNLAARMPGGGGVRAVAGGAGGRGLHGPRPRAAAGAAAGGRHGGGLGGEGGGIGIVGGRGRGLTWGERWEKEVQVDMLRTYVPGSDLVV